MKQIIASHNKTLTNTKNTKKPITQKNVTAGKATHAL